MPEMGYLGSQSQNQRFQVFFQSVHQFLMKFPITGILKRVKVTVWIFTENSYYYRNGEIVP